MSLVPVTAIDTGVLCAALQLSDSFYPTGAYSHSHGLEGLIEEGWVRDAPSLADYCRASLLPSLERVELPLVLHAYEALASGDWVRVGDLCVLSSALRTAREPRQASDAIGRQRIALLHTLRGDTRARDFLAHAQAGTWPQPVPVAAALEGLALGAPVEIALANVAYGTIAGTVSAAMKLLRVGQNAGQGVMVDLLKEVPGLVGHARRVPLAEIGWFNPWLDIASSRHEHASARLFIS